TTMTMTMTKTQSGCYCTLCWRSGDGDPAEQHRRMSANCEGDLRSYSPARAVSRRKLQTNRGERLPFPAEALNFESLTENPWDRWRREMLGRPKQEGE